MKKLTIMVLALALVSGMVLSAKAESLGFELGTMYYNCNDKNAQNGGGSFLAIALPVDAKTDIGFYKEGSSVTLEEDKNAATRATLVDIDVSIEAMLLARKLTDKFTAGLHIGMADIQAWDNLNAAITLNDTTPMADVFVTWGVVSGGDKIMTNLNVTLGYRVLQTVAFDPDLALTDFVDNINDLGGMWVAISLGMKF
jgi:hypothetical protein